jgi:hypothetical protein
MASEPMLVHNVFFTLHDNAPAARARMVAACKKYLANHPGAVSFTTGMIAEEMRRPVNDRDFDVSLQIVFRTKKDHDNYQVAPLHLQFIEENRANWKNVRVFDSLAEA